MEVNPRPWTAVYNDTLFDVSVSDGAFRTYMALRSYDFGTESFQFVRKSSPREFASTEGPFSGKYEAWPSEQRLAELLGVGERTIRNRHRDLQRAGWITIEKRPRRNGGGQYNVYSLLREFRETPWKDRWNTRKNDIDSEPEHRKFVSDVVAHTGNELPVWEGHTGNSLPTNKKNSKPEQEELKSEEDQSPPAASLTSPDPSDPWGLEHWDRQFEGEWFAELWAQLLAEDDLPR